MRADSSPDTPDEGEAPVVRPPPLPIVAVVEPRENGWLLRKLAVGERVVLGGNIILELRTHGGRPRIAISAPAEIRAVFTKLA